MKNFIFKSVLFLTISATFLNCSSDDNPPNVVPPAVVTKTKVSITKIELSQIPQYDNNGLPWDFNSNPDIYFKLFDENNVLGYTSNHLTDVMPSLSFPISVSFSNLSTTNISNSVIKIEVWDNDLDDNPYFSDEKIGEVPFYIYDYTIGTNKYPSFAVKNVNGTLITIYMNWE